MMAPETPTTAERERARQHPNGYVYRIDPSYEPYGEVPPQAIQGAWSVDPHGEIMGAFQRNPNYGRPLSAKTESSKQGLE